MTMASSPLPPLGAPPGRRTVAWACVLIACSLLAIVAGCGRNERRAPVAVAARPDSVYAPPGFAVPSDSLIPRGPLGASIRRGRAIMLATRDSLPDNVGNRLACTNCHREAGTRPESGPWVGVTATFPQYRARAGRVITIEDRVNGCLRRSMNGKPLDPDSRDMIDMVAYLAFLSTGVPQGHKEPWLGYHHIPTLRGDSETGGQLFAENCARCHGKDGQGLPGYPPLWGPDSYAIGAGMARIRTAAAFIRWNMPYDKPGTLTDQQAFDVAAFLLTHPRPDTPGKEYDWPNGDPPADVAYATLAAAKKGK